MLLWLKQIYSRRNLGWLLTSDTYGLGLLRLANLVLDLALDDGVVQGPGYVGDGKVVPKVASGRLPVDIPLVLQGWRVGVSMAPGNWLYT